MRQMNTIIVPNGIRNDAEKNKQKKQFSIHPKRDLLSDSLRTTITNPVILAHADNAAPGGVVKK